MIHRVGHVMPLIRPGGGPLGYLYNLYSASSELDGKNFDIVPFRVIDERVANKDSVRFKAAARSLKKLPTPLLNAFFRLYIGSLINRRLARTYSREYVEKLHGYSVLVFHDHLTAFPYFFKEVPKGQKVFVMPHGPADFATEIVDAYKLVLDNRVDLDRVHAWFQEVELRMYERSSGIISPTRSALDSYFSNNSGLRRRFERVLDAKHHSIVTGVPGLTSKEIERYRCIVNPHGRKFVVGYFGRLIDHKGFDLFLELVKSFKDRTDVQFICAGSGVMEVPIMDNLINLGWISGDIGEYLAVVDLLVSPNKYTYFDLLILESLSVGTPVITSDAGGSKYFGDHTPGVTLFKRGDLQDLVSKMEATLSIDRMSRELIVDVYKKEFSIDKFVQNHDKLATFLLLSGKIG